MQRPRLEYLEHLRNDSAFLDAIGADSILIQPRRVTFAVDSENSDIDYLMQAINEARINVWMQQDDSFFDQALIDVDASSWQPQPSARKEWISRTKGAGDTILCWSAKPTPRTSVYCELQWLGPQRSQRGRLLG